MEEGEIGNERERYKGREVEIGLDHLEVGKISGVEGSQREREGKIGRVGKGWKD